MEQGICFGQPMSQVHGTPVQSQTCYEGLHIPLGAVLWNITVLLESVLPIGQDRGCPEQGIGPDLGDGVGNSSSLIIGAGLNRSENCKFQPGFSGDYEGTFVMEGDKPLNRNAVFSDLNISNIQTDGMQIPN